MQTSALRKKLAGAASPHETPPLGQIIVDCDETRASDLQLRQQVHRVLDRMGYMPLRQLHVEIEESRIVLRGSVPTYYLKQLAQSAVRSIATERGVLNLVEVINYPRLEMTQHGRNCGHHKSREASHENSQRCHLSLSILR